MWSQGTSTEDMHVVTGTFTEGRMCSQGIWVTPSDLSRGINLKAASQDPLLPSLHRVSGPTPPPSCSLVGTDTMVGLGDVLT